MKKVNLTQKYDIERESQEKKDYTIKVQGTDGVYHLEVLASRVY